MIRKRTKQLFIAFTLIGLAIVYYSGIVTPNDRKLFHGTEFNSIKTVSYHDKNNKSSTLTLPLHKAGYGLTVYAELPSIYANDKVLAFRTCYQRVNIYLNKELIYPSTSLSNYNGNDYEWVFVPLPRDTKNGHVKIEFLNKATDSACYLDKLYVGNKMDIIIHLLDTNKFGIFISFSLFANSIFLLICACMAKLKLDNNSLIYISFYGLLFSIWSLLETSMGQVFIPNRTFLYYSSYLLFLLSPFPLIMFGHEKKQINKKTRNVLMFVMTCLFMTTTLFHILCVFDFETTFYKLHFLYVLIVFLVIIISIRNFYVQSNHTLKEKLTYLAFVILETAILFDLIKYCLYSPLVDSAFFTRIGFMLYVILLLTNTIKELYLTMCDGKQKDLWKEIAYKDVLTNMYSRLAFNEKMKSISQGKRQHIYTFLLIDINDLKKVNDTYGHSVGDQYIIESIHPIEELFRSYGKCYRIGGDEFTLILENVAPTNLNIYLKKLEGLNHVPISSNSEIKISFAFGSAGFDPTLDQSIYDTLKRADEKMYVCKKSQKNRSK